MKGKSKAKKLPAPRRADERRVTVRGAAYEAAGTGRRAKGWTASSLGVNSILSSDGDTLRRRSHDLLRQNPWAASAVESFVANCVGTGIKPQSRCSDLPFREQLHQVWNDWVDEADAASLTDYYGLQALAVRAFFEGGDVFVRLRERRPEDGLRVPLQLQLLEAEHCPATLNQTLPNGNVIRAGIEFNLLGQRVAYWLYRNHPGESLMEAGFNLQPVRVPAENILHIFCPKRPGQVRGEPELARSMIRLWEIDKYEDALLLKQQLAAHFTGFVTFQNKDGLGMFGETTPDEDGRAMAGLKPGSMQYLDPGEDVKFSDPPKTGDESGTFLKQQLRGAAAGVKGVPYANMTGDMSEANYSSLRAAILEFRRRCEMFIDNVMVYQFCRPVWTRFMTLAVLSGAVDARPFLRDKRDALRAVWIGQGWPWVDPLKEVEAKEIAVRNGFISRSDVITEQGLDPEQVDATIAADNARADRLGLRFDSDGRNVTGAKRPAREVALTQ